MLTYIPHVLVNDTKHIIAFKHINGIVITERAQFNKALLDTIDLHSQYVLLNMVDAEWRLCTLEERLEQERALNPILRAIRSTATNNRLLMTNKEAIWIRDRFGIIFNQSTRLVRRTHDFGAPLTDEILQDFMAVPDNNKKLIFDDNNDAALYTATKADLPNFSPMDITEPINFDNIIAI